MPPKPLPGRRTNRVPEWLDALIHELEQRHPTYLQQEPLWTVAELSGATKIAKSTIYEWVQQEYIPHIKLGGCIRFRPSEVMTWLDKHAKPGRSQRVPEVEV
jgi:excisionase family DNA binding protein